MSRGSRRDAASAAGRNKNVLKYVCVLGLLASIVGAGVWGPRIAIPSRPAFGEDGLTEKPQADFVTITLYFATGNALDLRAEEREVPRNNAVSVAHQAMAELAKGPSPRSNLFATIPPDARVTQVTLSGGLATVNWTQAFVDEHWGGSAGEWLTLQSIVKTMSQFDGIERVQLLIEGEPIETLAGHFEIDHPFPPKPSAHSHAGPLGEANVTDAASELAGGSS